MPKLRNATVHTLRLLKLIYEHQRVSRTDLGALTGYSAFLVSKLCDSLLRDGFINEVGSGDSSGGRRPTLLSIAPGLGRIVGLHVGRVNARVVVTDIGGNELAFRKAPSCVKEGPAAAMPHLIELIDRALEQANAKRSDVLGIGVGISGILDRTSGTTLYFPKVPQWVNVPVRQIIADEFGLVPEIEDIPRTMALAEQRLGVARHSDDWVYVMLGASVGAAFFLRGRLYTGNRGFAGEFGHMTVRENGALCGCGNRGCLNTIVSASALIQAAQLAVSEGLSGQLWQLAGGDPSRISVDLIGKAAEAGDRYAVRLLHEVGMSLGEAMVLVIHLFDPELIVLGGGLTAEAGRLLLPFIQEAVSERVLPRTAQALRIELSNLREADWAKGASLLVAEKALEQLFRSSLEVPKGASARKKGASTTLEVRAAL